MREVKIIDRWGMNFSSNLFNIYQSTLAGILLVFQCGEEIIEGTVIQLPDRFTAVYEFFEMCLLYRLDKSSEECTHPFRFIARHTGYLFSIAFLRARSAYLNAARTTPSAKA